MSREHLFSDWISALIPNTERNHVNDRYSVQLPGAAVKASNRNQGGLLAKRLRVVCTTCNTGWMSAIDKQAQPVMTPLILGQRTKLGGQEKRALAVWMTLKSIIGETDDEHKGITKPEVQEFFDSKRPLKNWRIWAGRYAGTSMGPARYLHDAIAANPPVGEFAIAGASAVPFYSAQLTTMVIGQLCIQAFSQTPNRPRLERHKERNALMHSVHPAGSSAIPWLGTQTLEDSVAMEPPFLTLPKDHLQKALRLHLS